MSSSTQWFDISNEGWTRMNAGRPPYELVRELVQNVLDEDFGKASLKFGVKGNEFVITIEDDVDNGISDSELITTVFMTGKEDSHLKRGRKGRGLKELLSVCYKAEVKTVGKTISFKEDGSRSEISNARTCGTKIKCWINDPEWCTKSVTFQIKKYLNKIIIYDNREFIINGTPLKKRTPSKSFGGRLSTQIINNGVQTEQIKDTIVDIYEKNPKGGWLFEMGIPVLETNMPFDIDIRQRIPMNDNRNDVSTVFLRDLNIAILQNAFEMLDKKDLVDWCLCGVEGWQLEYQLRDAIAQKITNSAVAGVVLSGGGKVFEDKAKQKGFKVFDTEGMSYVAKNILKSVMKTADETIRSIERDTKPVNVELNENLIKFVNVHKEIVKKALGLNYTFNVVKKRKDTMGNWTLAFHSGSSISYNILALGKIPGMSKKFFNNPYSVEAIDLLIHEIAHEKSPVHTERAYIKACTNYGAKIAIYLMGKNQETNTVQKKEKTVKTERKGTVKDNILRMLGERVLTLKEIYTEMGAESVGQKAGIRGVINRGCTNDGLFSRTTDSNGSLYSVSIVNGNSNPKHIFDDLFRKTANNTII